MTAATQRTDAHRPQVFDPADYTVIGYLDMQRPTYMPGLPIEFFEREVAQWRARVEMYFPRFQTDGAHGITQCNHCGHPGLRWVAVVEHAPTGDKLAFGEICADRVELPGRDAFQARFIHDRARREALAREAEIARAAFAEAHGDVVAYLTGLGDNAHHFMRDLAAKLARAGTLSDAQAAAARKFAANDAARAVRIAAEQAALADAPALAEGRYLIEGEVMSHKWTEDRGFGSQHKMLVKLADGNKVWGTVARSIEDALTTQDPVTYLRTTDDLKGQTVKFTATVERSQDDEHFGFYKRPSNATLTTTPEETA